MLIYSKDTSNKNYIAPDYNEKMTIIFQRIGFDPSPFKNDTHSSETLEFNLHESKYVYEYFYYCLQENLHMLLYPVVLCRWQFTTTHFTKRSDWKIYQMMYTHRGAGVLNLDNQIYHLTTDSICLLDCRTYHYFYSNHKDGWEYSLIQFDGNTADYFFQLIKKNGVLYDNLKDTEIKQRYDGIVSLAKNNPIHIDILFHKQMTSLLVDLAHSKASAPKKTIPVWLSEVQSYIIENYNKEWTIKQLAERSYLSDSRFAHIFKDTFHYSPIEYRDYLRMEHAKHYLTNTSLSIEQISEQVGYNKLSNFYAKFNKHTGIPPKMYRNQNTSLRS